MRIRDLRKIADFWISVFNLREWKITISWGTTKEMEDAVGRNIFSPEELASDIIVDRRQSDEQIEHTIIHELLHLVFDGHKAVQEVETYDTMHERALNRTAESFMKLTRRETNAK